MYFKVEDIEETDFFVIALSKVANRVSIGHTNTRVLFEHFAQIAEAVLVEELEKDYDVLEAAVHSLAVEGHHCVRRVAKQNTFVAVMRITLFLSHIRLRN